MRSSAYRRYITALLLLIYVANQLDRGVFNILMEPIKRQFMLSDGQLGFLAGPAIVVLYSLLGIPVARLADRRSRVAIMSVAIALWSLITVCTAMANDFVELAVARVGVGIGEAGFSAIAISVIGDYQNDENRARAISNFMLAIPISYLLSDLVGGWINQLYGWRIVFLLAGLPGIGLSILMRTTVREPDRRPNPAGVEASRVALREVLSTIWRRRSVRHLVIAQGLANVSVNAIGWVYVFFIRQHNMSTGELGSWLAVADSVGPFAGIWLSGFLSARLAVRRPDVNARLMAYAELLAAPLALLMLWCPQKQLALAFYLLLNIPIYYFLGPTQAVVQELVGSNMRATAASCVILIQLLAGGVIGTQVVGLVSDFLVPFTGSAAAALRWSMAAGSLITLWAAVHFLVSAKYIQRENALPAKGSPTHFPRTL
jgi:MFS family permease